MAQQVALSERTGTAVTSVLQLYALPMTVMLAFTLRCGSRPAPPAGGCGGGGGGNNSSSKRGKYEVVSQEGASSC